ncbi:candidapepsin-4 precursor, partial [Microthyrium microscopicum]
MKTTTCWAFASTTSTLVSAIQLISRSNPSVLSLDLSRKTTNLSPVARDRARIKKRSSLQLTLDNEQTLYFANVSLGTPGQSLRLDIDTGSSDLWANSAVSTLCQQYAQQCSASGVYNANSSSTYQYLNSDFYIKYADSSYAQGDYAADTVTMGQTSITSVPFGIGYKSTSAQGILGVGYPTNEASVSTTGKTYQNLPQILAQNKVTNTPSYSLWLNDLDANTGSILFGGVDTEKFTGSLATLPIIKEDGVYREFIIALTGVTAGGQTVLSSSSPVPVLLDSGSSLSYLPTTYAQSLFTIFSATYSSQSGAATVNCNLMSNTATVDFSFSGVTISVPMNELVIVDGTRNGRQVCILGISDAGDSTAVLGDTFLRSAYVVYDLSNNQISLAPTNFNATKSNVEEIASGTSGVPGASLVANAVTTLSVATGGARGPSVSTIPSGGNVNT